MPRTDEVGATPLLEFDFLEFAITHQTVEARLQQFVGGFCLGLFECICQGFFHVLHGRLVVTVRAAQRLAHDLVHHPSAFSRVAVIASVSAASSALLALFHRMEAQPSGEITA